MGQKNRKAVITYFQEKWDAFFRKFKSLQGDPAYIARGMAIGVFIGITPTIPLHTFLAVVFSIILRGSIAAAVLGVWICNPVTVLFFYIAAYYTGMLIIGRSPDDVHLITNVLALLADSSLTFSIKFRDISEVIGDKVYVLFAVLIGGIVIAIPSGIASYFITFKITKKIREKSKVFYE